MMGLACCMGHLGEPGMVVLTAPARVAHGGARPAGGRRRPDERSRAAEEARASPPRGCGLRAPVRTHPLEEAPQDRRIVEAVLLLDGEEWHPRGENAHEQPDALGPRGPAARLMDADAPEAARGRVLLRHPSVEIEALQLADAGFREAEHRAGVIVPAPLAEEARRRRIPDEPDGLARHAHPDLHLRADGHPLDGSTEHVHDESVPLVRAVPADLLAEQARGHAEPELRPRHPAMLGERQPLRIRFARGPGSPARTAGQRRGRARTRSTTNHTANTTNIQPRSLGRRATTAITPASRMASGQLIRSTRPLPTGTRP